MEESNPVVELLHLKNYFTSKGLLQSAFLLPFIIFISLYFFRLISDLKIEFVSLLIIIGSIELINFLFWAGGKVYKSIIPVKKNKINIALCLKIEEDSKKIHDELLKTLRRKLHSADIYNNFAIIELPEGTSFESRIEAEKFISDKDINLMIWGDTQEGTVDQGQVTIFHLNFSYNFNFSFNNTEQFDAKKNSFIQNINKAVVGRSWTVVHPNSLPTLNVVSENLTEVTLYVIIRCIISFGYILLGYEYSEQLVISLNNYPNKSIFPNFSEFRKIVTDIRQQLLILLTIYYSVHSENLDLAEKYSRKALDYNSASFPALIHLARISWIKGDKKSAYDFTLRAKRIEPSNNLVHFNEAFFALDQGNYEKVKNTYKKISFIPADTNIIEIVSFIENEYDTQHKLAFLFAAGYLNFKFADTLRGKEMLKLFKKKATKKPEYDVLLAMIAQEIK